MKMTTTGTMVFSLMLMGMLLLISSTNSFPAAGVVGESTEAPPSNNSTLLYGFHINSVSYLDLATQDMQVLPPPSYQPEIQISDLITSCLDTDRGILYTIGDVYVQGVNLPTSYLVGYSIGSGEIVSVSPLDSLQTATPDVRGIGVDPLNNVVYVMNAG